MLHPQEELWALLFLCWETPISSFSVETSHLSLLCNTTLNFQKPRIMEPPWPSSVHIGYNVVVITNSLRDD